MRARGSGYLYAAMLVAALVGRALDAGAVLPGVRETAMVRGGRAAWLTAVVSALVVSAAAAKRLSRTGCLRRTAYVVVAGQVLTFLAAEGAGRVANGLGPVDPDGLVGAGLQAAVAVALLVVVTTAWAVAVRAAPLQFPLPPVTEQNSLARTTNVLPSGAVASWVARGPPAGACT